MAFGNFARFTGLNSTTAEETIDTTPVLNDEAGTMITGLASGGIDSFDFTTITSSPEDPATESTTVNVASFSYDTGDAGHSLLGYLKAWTYAQQVDADLEAAGLEEVYAVALKNDAGGFDIKVVDVVEEVLDEPLTGFDFDFGFDFAFFS